MLNNIQETVRLSSNIARAIGIFSPLKALYVDDCVTNVNKIKTALSIIPNASYVIDAAGSLVTALSFCKKTTYDCLLVRENQIEMIEQIHIEPLIIVPQGFLYLNKWKLGYTLNDLILEALNQVSFQKLLPEQQVAA